MVEMMTAGQLKGYRRRISKLDCSRTIQLTAVGLRRRRPQPGQRLPEENPHLPPRRQRRVPLAEPVITRGVARQRRAQPRARVRHVPLLPRRIRSSLSSYSRRQSADATAASEDSARVLARASASSATLTDSLASFSGEKVAATSDVKARNRRRRVSVGIFSCYLLIGIGLWNRRNRGRIGDIH